MRTFFHVLIILGLGISLGLIYRLLQPKRPAGPGADEVVYSNDAESIAAAEAGAPLAAENPQPAKPPQDEAILSRFELTERSGETVTSEELLGQPYVVSFFFSTCPSICIQQNQKLKELQDQFEGQGVRFVAISVDPETDTPEKLREYAARFGADKDQWLFMTGDLTYIRRVGVEIFMQPIDQKFHTERFVLVDPKGEIEGFYNWPEEKQFQRLQEKIREMIDQSASKSS